MGNILFNIFPNENFIDLCMYQFGYEQCDPGHSFGPATRNHYLFHYILSGTGTLMADNAKGDTQTYSVKSGQGFMIFPGQINTYIADEMLYIVNHPQESSFHLIGHLASCPLSICFFRTFRILRVILKHILERKVVQSR